MSALPRVSTRPIPDWSPIVRDIGRTHDFEDLAVEGTIPAELAGTLFRNGPAVFSAGGQRFGHLFDGDGAITAVRVADGRVRGATRLVDTPERRAEQASGRPRYGGFGTISRWPLLDFLRGKLKNAANTSVLPWQGRLLALWEGGLPTELSPDDLSTLGPTTLGGAIPQAFSAHPHRVPSRRSWFNLGLRLGRRHELDLFALPDQGPARRLTTVPVGVGMLHDFAVTERHAVALCSPLIFRPLDFALGRASYVDALDWRPERGTEVILIELDAPHRVQRFAVEPFYQWHFANAFEDGDRVVIDFVRYPDYDTDRWLRGVYAGRIDRTADGRLVRATLDPKAERLETTELWDRSTEFPLVDGRFEAQRSRVLWTCAHTDDGAASTTPLDRIARVDLESGAIVESDLGPGTFPAEPVFVPRGEAEGDGWLVTVGYDAERAASFFSVLDATTLEERGRAWFDQPVPMTFHGRWLEA